MAVDYDKISGTYDQVRKENRDVLEIFIRELNITGRTRILDFGCGTGNYADALQKLTHAQVYGVDPSDGMREKAMAKNPHITVLKGNHEYIPFEDAFFDFVYMTDVIHHIPDIWIMFKEIGRVLKSGGSLCIATQSHEQIDNRFYVKYFPTTAAVDKRRYPDIDEIIRKAREHGFDHTRIILLGEGREVEVTSDFVELVRNKGYSMFHLIPNDEYKAGLKQLEADVSSGSMKRRTSGQTLVWLGK